MEIYVDDPIVAIRGTQHRRKRLVCIFTLAWLSLGFPLAFQKAQLGQSVSWIGAAFAWEPGHVKIHITKERMASLGAECSELLSVNIISIKRLRSFIGVAESFAGLLFVWRSFVNELWAALNRALAELFSGCPRGYLWTRMVSPAISWLRASLQSESEVVERTFSLEAYLEPVGRVTIFADASPWGMGAALQVAGCFVEWFGIPFSAYDINKYE